MNPEFSILRNNKIHHTAIAIGWLNMYDCTIGENVFIGPFCELGNAVVGNRTRISSHCYIPPHVTFGEDCFIAHGVMFTNDTFETPETYKDIKELAAQWTPRPTEIGDRVRIGSGAVILPVRIGDDCIVGAGCVVTRDVPDGCMVVGVPGRQVLRRIKNNK
jgi:acetyltransferase-like isoleucine patch superfamily enzyme